MKRAMVVIYSFVMVVVFCRVPVAHVEMPPSHAERLGSYSYLGEDPSLPPI